MIRKIVFALVSLATVAVAQPQPKQKRKLVTTAECATVYRLASLSPAGLIDPVADDRKLQYCIKAYDWKPGQVELLQVTEQKLSAYIRKENLDRTAVVITK